MPIFDYQCNDCGYNQEVMRKASVANTEACPECGKETFSKLLSAPSFKLNGTGWYATDFKYKKSKPVADSAPKETKKAEAAPSAAKSE